MRRKPYTTTGIRRVPCFRCGEPSKQQWQICSLGDKWVGICGKCDIKLNSLVLKFMQVIDWRQIIEKYKQKVSF